MKRNLRYTFSLLNVDYVRLNRRWNYKNVISPYHRIYLIDEGRGAITSGRKEWLLEPGHMYIIPSYTLCDLKCPNHLGQYFIHFFETTTEGLSLFHNNRSVIKRSADPVDIANFKRILAINPNRKINRSDNPQVYEKKVFYKEYEELNRSQLEADFLETQGIILQLLAKFVSSGQFQAAGTGFIPARVVDLTGYIQMHLGEKLNVGHLAKMVALHPDYFSRLFLQLTGQRPMAYIHERRIERAQYLIETSDLPLSQVAELTGFCSLPHFIKVFKKLTRLTPKQYRAQDHTMV